MLRRLAGRGGHAPHAGGLHLFRTRPIGYNIVHMTRRDWWIGIVLIVVALLLHAAVPRYEWLQLGAAGTWSRADRWSGALELWVLRPQQGLIRVTSSWSAPRRERPVDQRSSISGTSDAKATPPVGSDVTHLMEFDHLVKDRDAEIDSSKPQLNPLPAAPTPAPRE
jgi:hypothetical protein